MKGLHHRTRLYMQQNRATQRKIKRGDVIKWRKVFPVSFLEKIDCNILDYTGVPKGAKEVKYGEQMDSQKGRKKGPVSLVLCIPFVTHLGATYTSFLYNLKSQKIAFTIM